MFCSDNDLVGLEEDALLWKEKTYNVVVPQKAGHTFLRICFTVVVLSEWNNF